MQVFGNIAFNPDTEYNRHVNFHTFGAGILVLFRWDILWIFFCFLSTVLIHMDDYLVNYLDEYIGNVHKWRPTIFDTPYLPCPTIFTLWHLIFGVILEPLPTLKWDIIDGRSLPIFIFCENCRKILVWMDFKKPSNYLLLHFSVILCTTKTFLRQSARKTVQWKFWIFTKSFNKSQHSSSILTAELFCDWIKN